MRRYLGLVEVADRRGAIDLVTELADAGASVDDLVGDLLVPAQHEVGRRWERREWNVAHEHAATAIADAALARVVLDAGAPGGGSGAGEVVVGCVEGEWHMMAARMVAEVFRARGWSVTFLGPSVPADDLAEYAAATAPDCVALSASLPTLLPAARRGIAACRGEGVAVLAGGNGFGADGRYAGILGADAWEPGPTAGVHRLNTWLDAPPADRPPLLAEDDEQLLLEASRWELATSVGDRFGREAAVDLALGAIESASAVDDPGPIRASIPMIERALPAGTGAVLLESLLPAVRARSPRAAALVERATVGE